MLYFFIVFVLLAFEIGRYRPTLRDDVTNATRWLQARISYQYVPAMLLGLVLSFVLERLSVERLNRVFHVPYGLWLQQLPLSITLRYPFRFVPLSFHLEFLALGIVQALLIGAYLVAMHGRAWRRRDTLLAAATALAMVAVAVLSRAVTSEDMYAYVADSLLGNRAYDPPATPLPGEFALIHHMWKLPLLPAAYGPFWLWWNQGILGLAHGLNAKLMLLRAENVAALASIVFALHRLRVAPRLIAATAFNPAIAFFYILDGHNDLVAIAIILVAMTFAASVPIAAGILAGFGASMKLTLVIPAAAAALIIASLPKRIVYAAAMLAVAGSIAVFFGGKPYFHAISVISADYSGANERLEFGIPHFTLAFVMVALTALAVFMRRSYFGATFGFATLAQALYPWYAIWGLPYAVTRTDQLTALLVGLPVIAAVIDAGTAPKLALVGAFVGAGILAVMALRRTVISRLALEA